MKTTLNIHWKNWCWRWWSKTFATWCEELIHWKRPWYWERLKAGGDDRGWDVWMASLIQCIWIWAITGRWWRMEKSGMLQSMASQRVRQSLVTEQQPLPIQTPLLACESLCSVQDLKLLSEWSYNWWILGSSYSVQKCVLVLSGYFVLDE